MEAKMTEIDIKSKIIAHLSYDDRNGYLRIVFRNKETRLFAGVPKDVVDAMAAAPSPGQFYIDRIRGNFKRLAA
jgi:hypothetical protein